jgi:hypothetical protein
MNSPIDPTLLFSAYAFIWCILYYCVSKLAPSVPLDSWNPTVAIIIACAYQLYALLAILFRSPLSKMGGCLLNLAIITILFKAGPLWLVWNSAVINSHGMWLKSTISCGLAFIIYVVHLFIRRVDMFVVYSDLTTSFVDNDNRIPPLYWVEQIWK